MREFDRQMRLYIESMPSQHYSVRYYGAQIAEHMASHAGDDTAQALAELARWEWTLADVFDAADDAALEVRDAGRRAARGWSTVSFSVRASVRRVQTRTNAVDRWRAVNGICDGPRGGRRSGPREWVLWRRGVRTLFRSLTSEEAAAFDAVREGATFATVCEQLTQYVEESEVALRAASLLRGWIAEELIAGFAWHDAEQ